MKTRNNMTSDQWGSHPLIYEVNTWPWLAYLSKKYSRTITLLNVPEDVFTNDFAPFDAVWLMGVWTRSPSGTDIAKNHTGLLAEYKEALPDFSLEDVVGSPYSIYQYEVDPHLGGQEELETFSAVLHQYGKKLILDFVPNHVAVDHEWSINHPEYFLHGSKGDLERDPRTFFALGDAIYAHGKDPYFPAWTDTLQVNPFSPEYRAQTISTLSKMTEYCDGVRCDMAMLLVSSVFWQTWGERTAAHLEEFWSEVIRTVKQDHPQFLFIAEVYWGMEWDLQQMGFDLCYDKRLYDRLLHDSVDRIKGHL
ncbi:MAG: alpha-amylase family glycosyl hydrolase, partial [Promethearchaeota archaeon]